MAQRHVIKRQILELTAQPPEQAQRLQGEMSHLYRQHIVPLIDKFCTELSAPDRLHRIESLTLDIGPIDSDHFADEFVDKVSRQLRQALADQISAEEQRQSSQGLPLKHVSQLELFTCFAKTGAVPWWADMTQPHLLTETLQYLLDEASQALRHCMRELARDRRSLLRVVNHYPEHLLAALVRLLVPALNPSRGLDAEDLMALLAQGASGEGVTRHDTQLFRQPRWRQLIWQQLLDVGSLTGRLNPTPSLFYRAVFTRVAVESGISFDALIAELQRLSRLEPPTTDTPLVALLESFRQEPSGMKPSPQGQDDIGARSRQAPFEATQPSSSEALAALVAAVHAQRHQLPPDARAHVATLLHELEQISRIQPHATTQIKHREIIQKLRAMMLAQNLPLPPSNQTHMPDRLAEIEAGESESNIDFGDVEELYLTNAGLVILWPFLPTFFARSELVNDQQFVNADAVQRAVGLLQVLATGDEVFPEYLLPLNKLICGLELSERFEMNTPITPAESDECTALLQAVIEQAPILRDMSVEGFRGTFLLRQGVLRARDGAWLLQVERQTYDVVLDRFPWSWGWVKLPWMDIPLQVEW